MKLISCIKCKDKTGSRDMQILKNKMENQKYAVQKSVIQYVVFVIHIKFSLLKEKNSKIKYY